jgi:hypothetical protein
MGIIALAGLAKKYALRSDASEASVGELSVLSVPAAVACS